MKRVVYIFLSLLLMSLFIEAKTSDSRKNVQHKKSKKIVKKSSKKMAKKTVEKLNKKEVKPVVEATPAMTIVNPSIIATRGDVKIIEASENIRYLSQKIVKDYLFFYKNPTKTAIKNKLNSALGKLSSDFRIIATTTKDTDTKDILEFLAYSKDQIEEIFTQEPDEEKTALMLDYSETLLEGADSIAFAHKYDFSSEEKMLMVTKKIEYLLERISKYYMAIHAGFNTSTNQEQLNVAMVQLEENIQKINVYRYPKEMLKHKEDFIYAWRSSQGYFDVSKQLFIPSLMSLSVENIENIVDKLAIYHSQNQ